MPSRFFLLQLAGLLVFMPASEPKAQVRFAAQPTWTAVETSFFSTGLDVGDIDQDGWPDLAVSNGNDKTPAPNLIYLNTDGTLANPASWVSGDLRYSGHCALADIDGDSYPELMVANYLTSSSDRAAVQVYRNVYGVMDTSPSWESPDGFSSFRACFGDPDGDGDLDLAVATGEIFDQANLVFFNTDGRLEEMPSWQSDVEDVCMDVRFVDVDGDHDQDLAFLGGFPNGRIRIYFNVGGVLQRTPGWTTSFDDNGNTFDFDDLDGDGRLDMVVGFNSYDGGSGRFATYLTDGGFLPRTPTWRSNFSGYASAVVCADVDGQNGPDLIAGAWWDELRIYLNDGSGGFQGDPDWMTQTGSRPVAESICLVDLDHGRTSEVGAEFPPGSRLLSLPSRHLQSIDRVTVDGVPLPRSDWCSSLRDGWISLSDIASGNVEVRYRVSDQQDLALSSFDAGLLVFHAQSSTGIAQVPPTAGQARVSAYPNPFNPVITFSLHVDCEADDASLALYDPRGRLVDTIFQGSLSAETHELLWQPTGLQSGVYTYRFMAGAATTSGKVTLLK